MKKSFLNMFVLILLIIATGCMNKSEPTADQKAKLKQLKKEISENLTLNLLPYWSNNMVDTSMVDFTEE